MFTYKRFNRSLVTFLTVAALSLAMAAGVRGDYTTTCGCCATKTASMCGVSYQGPSATNTQILNQVDVLTGAVHFSETDFRVPGNGLHYAFTSYYISQLADGQECQPCETCIGDAGWGWYTINKIRMVEDGSNLIVVYDNYVEREFEQVGSDPVHYAAVDDDWNDDIYQEVIQSITYWVLTKCSGYKYYFYPLDQATPGPIGGCLRMIKSPTGDTLTFTYGANGLVSSVASSSDNTTVTLTYYTETGKERLLKKVDFGDTEIYFKYDEKRNLVQKILKSGDEYRTTIYMYKKSTGQLSTYHDLYAVIRDPQVKELEDLEVISSAATRVANNGVFSDIDFASHSLDVKDFASQYYTYDASERVSRIESLNELVVDITYDDSPATGAMEATAEYADSSTETWIVDSLGRTLSHSRNSEETEYTVDYRGRVTQIEHPDGHKTIYIHNTDFNWTTLAGTGTSTAYPSYVLFKSSDGLDQRVLTKYTYGVTGFGGLPKSVTTFKNGTSSDLTGDETVQFVTEYHYNSDGTVKYAVQPKVTGWLPCMGSSVDYRMGVEYTYSNGKVASKTNFICDSYTAGSTPSFDTKVDQTTTTYTYFPDGDYKGMLWEVIVDPDGLALTTEYEYDSNRRPSKTIVDPDGLALTTEYTYSPLGKLLNTTSPGGYYTENTYTNDKLTMVERFEDDNKTVQLAKTEYAYDDAGRRTTTTRYRGAADSASSYTTYDSMNRVENQIDYPDGSGNYHGTKYTYNSYGNVSTAATGGVWSGGATGSWSTNPVTVRQTSYATNHLSEGVVASTSDGYGDNYTANTYDERGRLETVTRQKGVENYGPAPTLKTTLYTEYTYDNRGLVTKTVNKKASNTTLNETNITYDGMGRAVCQKLTDGAEKSLVTTTDYDQNGRVWQVTDAAGNSTVTEYDSAGRAVRQIDAEGNVVETEYDKANRAIKTIRKEHKPGAGTQNEDYIWYVVAYNLNDAGQIIESIDQGEDTDYDRVGEGADGSDTVSDDYLVTETTYSHEAFRTNVVVTDPNGIHTKSRYDGLGRRICLSEGGTGTLGSETYEAETYFEYEPSGRLKRMVSGGPNGEVGTGGDDQQTSYVYTNQGQLSTTTYPDSETVTNTYYENNGALNTTTDQNGTIVSYQYTTTASPSNGAYNLITRQYVSGGTSTDGDQYVITNHDGLGRLLCAMTWDDEKTQTSLVENTYKFCGALESQSQQMDTGSTKMVVEYDHNSCAQISRAYWPYASGGSPSDFIRYDDYDGLNRACTIGTCSADLVKYKYVGRMVAAKEYPQSDTTKTVRQTFWSSSENNYDPFGRLDRVHTVRDPLGTPTDLVDLQYKFDDVGNITARYDDEHNSGGTAWSQKYSYNNQNQLACALEGAMTNFSTTPTISSANRRWAWDAVYDSVTYSLDALGNWEKFYNNGTVDERTHNDVNELTSRTAGGTLSYDDNGNLTDNGTSYKCVYDFRNRLIEVTTRDATPKTIAEYFYDALNRRIEVKTYDTNETLDSDTRYIYDKNWSVIEERDEMNSSALTARYVYGAQYIDEPVLMYRDGNADDDFADTDEVLYYLQDRLFNVVALTDANGIVRESICYAPYGRSINLRESDSNEQVASHFGNPYLFTGRRLDDKTCFYHYRNRYYSVAMGRFISRDPIGYEAEDINLYQYVKNTPLNATDPTGEKITLRGTKEQQEELLKLINELCPEGKFYEGNPDVDNPFEEIPEEEQEVLSANEGFCDGTEPNRPCDKSKYPASCGCVCDAIKETSREFVIVRPSIHTPQGGCTTGGDNPVITIGTDWPVSGTGDCNPPGGDKNKVRTPQWLLLAHELCAHDVPRLGKGDRDKIIEIENEIRREHDKCLGQRDGKDHAP